MTDIQLAYGEVFKSHRPPWAHPENPGRLGPLYAALACDEVLSLLPCLDPLPLADSSALRSFHTAECVDALMALRGQAGWCDADTYYEPDSLLAALTAVGTTKELAKNIYSGKVRRGFALLRPPGHHARPTGPMGFCLFNNVGVAAATLLQTYPSARIAIVDFDLHHGNGTQESFYESDRVLFLSSHRFPYYPGTGGMSEHGKGSGLGLTVNFPLAKAYADPVLAAVYGRYALPIVEAFRPDMILVSAGYDGHVGDPMQGFRLSTSFYAALTEGLLSVAEEVCSGKILFCLEGGYSPEDLCESVLASLSRFVTSPRQPFSPQLHFETQAETEVFLQELKPFFPELV
ncbi:MAG: histone deacetylase [Bdellovibrionales bacterium]|nr:histone deacetylase [Bdellovibrionales bacterium]